MFVHYPHALTLEPAGENRAELRELSDMPIVELDRMVSAARPAILEIETNACENDDGRQYYSNMGTECGSSMPAPVEAQNAPSL